MRLHVLCAFVMMLATSFAGCIGDSDIEQITDEITEVLGCMDEAAINYDHNATVPSNLCLSMDQIIAAEEIFWSSWDSDDIDNLTEPVGYRLMITETSEGVNESRALHVQEVFAPTYYDQEFEYRTSSNNINGDVVDSDVSNNDKCPANTPYFQDWNTGPGCDKVLKCEEDGGYPIWNTGQIDCRTHQVITTIFDNHVQVENFDDSEWNNYSMETVSTYDEFRNRLEHGPGIRNTIPVSEVSTMNSDNLSDELVPDVEDRTGGRAGKCPSKANFAQQWNENTFGCKEVLQCEAAGGVPVFHFDGFTDYGTASGRILCHTKGSGIAQPSGVIGFPPIDQSEFKYVEFQDVSSTGGGRTQTIYYFAKDYNTGTEIEVMGEMTEDGFKITEYCNVIQDSSSSIIDNYQRGSDSLMWGISESNGSVISVEDADDNDPDILTISARIILLEVNGGEMRFEEYDYVEPVKVTRPTVSTDDGLGGAKAIPFYFEGIYDEDANESENESATEGRKGLNAVNVKVVIAGPSGPYGMEGDLSDYRLVTSNCTLDNKTTGIDATTEADDETTSARSEGTNGSDNNIDGDVGIIYGSAGNSCTDIDAYDLSDIDELLEKGITFVDADSSGTLSEGDRFEFSENYTCDDCAEANMLRLYSISADGFSDENINPSSEISAVHEGAMNAIRNIRAVAPDDPPPAVEPLTRDFIGIDSTDSES